MRVKISIVAVTIVGFLMLGAGTAHAFGHAWTLVEQCTEKGSGDRYILKKSRKKYGIWLCKGGKNCQWLGSAPTEDEARNMIPLSCS
tara:strand:+ start:308 stop:568 length:261 start_codon:yes stop_codon:yes gene_type:complete